MRKLSVAAALFAAAQANPGWSQAAPEPPKIIVDGYGEVKTAPDLATIAYSLRGEGRTSDEAVKAMVASGVLIEKALRSVDPAVEPRTSEIRVSPARGGACRDRNYDREDDQLSTGACAVVGYVATQSVTVRTSAVKDSGTMVGLAARNGYNVNIENFSLSDVRPAQRQAIAAALADAQTKAASLAAGSHVTLGAILTISTAGREAGQQIVVTGSRIAQPDVVSMLPVAVNLNAEQITTGATVTVTYAIAR
jgi:uncharacterized protein YggE